MSSQTLFEAGTLGYAGYRIPALLALPGGRVLAFCEGRVNGLQDYGTIRTLVRISTDGGRSFGPQRVVAEDGENTVGNPTPVFDPETGRIWLFLNGNLRDGHEMIIRKNQAPRTVLLTFSADGGETWAPLRDLTRELKPEGWTWYACAPGHALRTRDGTLLIPCNHHIYDARIGDSPLAFSHHLRSDDHGESWSLGPDVGPETSEATLAELPDGRLYLNMRSFAGNGCRTVSFSRDGGRSWEPPRPEPALPDSCCEGSVLTVPGGVLFSNAADPEKRVRMTVRFSPDALRWETLAVPHEGCAAYSDLCLLPDGKAGCLYECGDVSPYERIVLTEVPLPV